MPGQHRAGEVVEAPRAPLAAVALPVRLAIVAPVADHRGAAAPGATHAFRPAVLAHEGKALGVVHQAGKIDQTGCSIECSHDHGAPRDIAAADHPAALIPSEVLQTRQPLLCLPTPRNPKRASRYSGSTARSASASAADRAAPGRWRDSPP